MGKPYLPAHASMNGQDHRPSKAIDSVGLSDFTEHSTLFGRKASLDLLPQWRTCNLIESLERADPRNPLVQMLNVPVETGCGINEDLLGRYIFGSCFTICTSVIF